MRPGTGREGALGYERYFAIEHRDVRREAFQFCTLLKKEHRRKVRLPQYSPALSIPQHRLFPKALPEKPTLKSVPGSLQQGHRVFKVHFFRIENDGAIIQGRPGYRFELIFLNLTRLLQSPG